jgi:deoxyribodipyrimidine photo-lyase
MSMGCQWVAGSGAYAAPCFRIFNPFGQGEKFDPDGDYIRQWLPELMRLPNQWIHRPGEASEAVLDNAGVRLGTGYPWPVVEHRAGRERALAALKSMKAEIPVLGKNLSYSEFPRHKASFYEDWPPFSMMVNHGK